MGLTRRRLSLALAALPSLAAAQGSPAALEPALEARARALGRRLRCPVCQGEPIDESGSDFAARVRAEVRRRLAAGESDEAIVAALVARYGPAVDGRPPSGGWAAPLWALGPAVVLAGLGLAWAGAPRRRGLGRRPPG
jgi:cytochrome c-type biogenesis protein CcmH